MVLPLCVTAGSQHLDRANGSLTRITVGWCLLASLHAVPSARTQVKGIVSLAFISADGDMILSDRHA